MIKQFSEILDISVFFKGNRYPILYNWFCIGWNGQILPYQYVVPSHLLPNKIWDTPVYVWLCYIFWPNLLQCNKFPGHFQMCWLVVTLLQFDDLQRWWLGTNHLWKYSFPWFQSVIPFSHSIQLFHSAFYRYPREW